MSEKIIKIGAITVTVVVIAMVGFFLFPVENIKEYVALVKMKPEKQYIQIGFAGDSMFDRGIRYYADQNGDNDFIFQNIKDFLLKNDLNVVNLEGPITDNESISAGSAPGSTKNYFFTFDPSVAATLHKNNIKLVNLGNNHIENFKKEGIVQTEKYLTDAGVDFFGSPYGAKSIIKDIEGLKVAFVNYNQFLADLPEEWGATMREIQEARLKSDIVMVFCHWGVEYALSATPEQIDLGRRFVDAGADLVIGAHPHVTEPMEEYKGKRIYYSLGNFIFDQYFSEDVRTGLFVSVKIDKETKSLEFTENRTYLQSGGQTILLDH